VPATPSMMLVVAQLPPLTVMLASVLVAVAQQWAGAASTVDRTEDFRSVGFPDGRKIARDSQGNLYVAYRKKDSAGIYQVYVAKSEDGGATWCKPESPIATLNTDHQRVPSIAIDGHDVLHVVWYGKGPTDSGANERQIKYTNSKDRGATWSPWVSVGGEVRGYRGQDIWQEHPTIYVDGNNHLYVVWQGRDDAFRVASQCKFSKSVDGGSTWSTWRNVSPSNSNLSRPTLVTNTDGSRLYVLGYGGSGIQQILFSISADGGSTWSTWSPINASRNDQRHVSVAIDGTDHLHAVWREVNSSGKAEVEYSIYSGSKWTAPLTVSANAASYQFFPSIAVTAFNTVAVVWTETSSASGCPREDPSSGQIRWSYRNSGGVWRRGLIPGGERNSIYATLRFGGHNNGGNVDILWLRKAGLLYDIVTARLMY